MSEQICKHEWTPIWSTEHEYVCVLCGEHAINPRQPDQGAQPTHAEIALKEQRSKVLPSVPISSDEDALKHGLFTKDQADRLLPAQPTDKEKVLKGLHFDFYRDDKGDFILELVGVPKTHIAADGSTPNEVVEKMITLLGMAESMRKGGTEFDDGVAESQCAIRALLSDTEGK